MKLLKISILFSLLLLLSSSVFADVNNSLVEPSLVFCPEKIVCSGGGDGDITSSCHPDDPDKAAYVGRIMGYGVSSGSHSFKRAYSKYKYPHLPFVQEVMCQYDNIELFYSPAANLEVYYTKPSKWDISTNSGIANAMCASNDPKSCPLISKPELVIDMKLNVSNPHVSIKTMAYGKIIKIVNFKTGSYFDSFMSITYDDAFVACNGVKQCPIDIYYGPETGKDTYSYYYYVGNVVVDMTDNMKILQINTGSTHGGTGGYLLKKQEPFNAITFVN